MFNTKYDKQQIEQSMKLTKHQLLVMTQVLTAYIID